jgi:hypothetical protein
MRYIQAFLWICFPLALSAQKPADLLIRPAIPHIWFTPNEGVVTEVTVLNKGADMLVIDEVKASCFCASPVIMHSRIRPMGLGKIRISVNTDRMAGDSISQVDFTIRSNAAKPVMTFPLILHNRQMVKDTSAIQFPSASRY